MKCSINSHETEYPEGTEDAVSYRWICRMVGFIPTTNPKLTYSLPNGFKGEAKFGDTVPATEGAVYTVEAQ